MSKCSQIIKIFRLKDNLSDQEIVEKLGIDNKRAFSQEQDVFYDIGERIAYRKKGLLAIVVTRQDLHEKAREFADEINEE